MIRQSTIDTILDRTDIVEIIGEFVELKKKGVNFSGISPFTDEKNPSFVVSPTKQIFSCFSSGVSGGVVKFLKLHKGWSFPDAIRFLGERYNIEVFENDHVSKEDQEKLQTKEALYNLNEFAADFFQKALPLSKPAAEYASHRISRDHQTEFSIGYAPNDWQMFRQAALDAGFSETQLLLSGLVSQNESGNTYDFFRNRIIFPIHNHMGRISAFAGRSLDDSQPKYLNVKGTPVFNKSNTLYGLFFAQGSIRKTGHSVLVEGYTDVITLHSAGILNTVAPCGTALTAQQCDLLARYSKNVLMLYDGDEPGQKAAIKNARVALENGLLPFVVQLPEQEDPDSFVRNHPEINLPEYISSKKTAFPIWYADRQLTDTVDDPVLRNEAIKNICSVLALYQEDSLVQLFVESISKKFKILRAIFLDKIKETVLANERITVETGVKLPPHVNPMEFQKWGFYEDKNQYFFHTKDGIIRYSNFIMNPMFHVESAIDTRRIFELTNYAGHKVTIDFDMFEITSLVNFRRVIEGKGNFLFWGQETQLTKLKMKWYEQTKTCSEIRNLGWQKEGFWAWSNGISSDGSFQDIDATGLVIHGDRHFFIPAFSNIYLDDKSIFLDERKFLYLKRDISVGQWAKMFIEVFGINAQFGIAYYISALFRDHILHLFNNFPILNLFGPKGTGKSQMAMSLSCLFGKQQTPFNIHNGTKAGLAEHIQQFINAFAWIDEYKNNIEYDKIETLKSIYDSIGRNRLNYDKGKKKETTLVNSAVILSGQEMPTADVALFSRVIFLQFHQTEYSSQEKARYDQLKALEKQGLSQITTDIIRFRKYYVEHYYEHYDIVLSDLFTELKGTVVEDRILRSWCAILASIHVLAERIGLPFTYDDIKADAVRLLIYQNSQITSSNEIATFWDMIEALFDANILLDKWHFVITFSHHLRTRDGNREFPGGKEILKIKFNAIYKLYSEHTRKSGEKALPSATLKYYLENSKCFLGKEPSTKFYRKDYVAAEGQAVEQRQVTTSYCFDYSSVGINLVRMIDQDITSNTATSTFNEENEPF